MSDDDRQKRRTMPNRGMSSSGADKNLQVEFSDKAARSRARILGLESHTCLLEGYRSILERAGYEFFGTCSEEKALHFLRTQPPDLFIQNLTRPLEEVFGTSDEQKMLTLIESMSADLLARKFVLSWSGRCDFLRLIKSDKRLCDIPVLLISGFRKVTAIDMLREAGLLLYRAVDGYLEKPWSVTDLLAFVNTILVRRAKLLPM